jgi:hypothetical protein
MKLRALIIVLLTSMSLWSAVAFDASMTGGNSTDGTTQQAASVITVSSTGITVGASASCLIVTLCFDGNPSAPTSITATWNGASMTNAGSIAHSNLVGAIFRLVNPASGAKTLTASWTNSSDVYMSAVSFTGTDTSTCINNADTKTATTGTSLTVPSTTTGATVATFCTNGGTPTMNFTAFWDDSALAPGGGGSYEIGGTSNAHSFTGAGGTLPTLVGVHLIAPGAPCTPTLALLGAGCK